MQEIIMETKKMCKSFKSPSGIDKVLEEIDLQINKGEMVVIKGKSGKGKSTLLNILAATMMADSGEVLYKNRDLQKMSNSKRAEYRRKSVGYIPQNLYLLNDRNIFMNIALPLQYANEEKNRIRCKVEEVAEWFDIRYLLKKTPQTLSRGEKQRVAICRAIVMQPEILFADEPTGSLDGENEQLVLEMFKILKKKSTTLVVTTHDDTVTRICDTLYKL